MFSPGSFSARLAPLILAALAAPQGPLTAADQAPRRPNVLFVYTDDQRWDAMGVVQKEQGEHARFPWFRTPHMDRLAAEGVRFRNAFVVNSLCAPSRANFLTGRYSHENGVANNHTPFPIESVTHASLMRAAGYRTGYVGKWHMGGQKGKRPGFDYSASFVGQGRYVDCPFEVDGVPTTTEGWVDDRSTDFAIAFMKENRDRPFSLVVGFKSCHGPTAPRSGPRAGSPGKSPPLPERGRPRHLSRRRRRPAQNQGPGQEEGRGGQEVRRVHPGGREPGLFPLHLRGRRQPGPDAGRAR